MEVSSNTGRSLGRAAGGVPGKFQEDEEDGVGGSPDTRISTGVERGAGSGSASGPVALPHCWGGHDVGVGAGRGVLSAANCVRQEVGGSATGAGGGGSIGDGTRARVVSAGGRSSTSVGSGGGVVGVGGGASSRVL